jgi:hypothetical protein
MQDTEKQVIIDQLAPKLKALMGAPTRLKNVGDQVKGWSPVRGDCHRNVDRWVADHPEDIAVRGWISTQYQARWGFYQYSSHSVVQTGAGELIDVTLPQDECPHDFVQHPGPDAEFLALVDNNGCPWVEVQLDGPDPRLQEYADLAASMDVRDL